MASPFDLVGDLFNIRQNATEDALQSTDRNRMQQVANNVAAAGARTNSNPVALARFANQAGADERSRMAMDRARMLADARVGDIGGGLNMLSSAIPGVMDLVQGLGGPVGAAAGTALGGPIGGMVGGAAGNALGALVGGKGPPTASAQTAAVPQTLPSWMQQQNGAAQPQQRPEPVPFDRPTDSPSNAAVSTLESTVRPSPTPLPSASQPAGPLGGLTQALQGVDLFGGLGGGGQGWSGPRGNFNIRSDEDSKTALEDASRAIDQFLASMSPTSFNYRNPNQAGAQQGRQTGVLAQDLERSDVGRQMVERGPDGQRMINAQSALSALLAAQGRVNDRLSALEGGAAPREGLQPGSRMREMSPREFHAADPPEAALLRGMEQEDAMRRANAAPLDAVTGAAQAAPPPRTPTRQEQVAALPRDTVNTTSVTLPGRPMPGPGDRVRLPNLEPAPQPSVLDRFLSTVEPYVPSVARGLFR